MWEKGNQLEVRHKIDAIEALNKAQGDISNEEARLLLYHLFRQNLGITWNTLAKTKIFEFQEIIMNGWFKKDYSIFVAGRGIGKSYLLGIFCLLYCIFHPNAKIVIVANNFRRVKDIFSQMEKFIKRKEAYLLRQCFSDNFTKSNDQHICRCLNGSQIKGLPLGVGENLRGERANVLIIDEGLLISEHVQDTILRPFLTAKLDVAEQEVIKEQENLMIKEGKMKEEDRTVFPNNKLLITSSASYQFEYLYEGIYRPWQRIILDEHRKRNLDDPSYFVSRMSYKAVPDGTIMDESVLKAAAEGKEDNPTFQREYCAIFADSSDSYFNVKKLHECTIDDGDLPTVQIKGDRDREYILAIDPAYGDSKSNDFFAMGVYMLVPEERRIVQVHSYGKAGADVRDHYKYLIYILKHFNIVFSVIDGSGTEFINGFNESVLAHEHKMNVGLINADFEAEDHDYIRELRKAKAQFNKETRNFMYPQPFSALTIRRMNEYLQGGISAKKVWFASKICQNEVEYDKAKNFDLPFNFNDNGGENNMVDFLDDQDDWIPQTKRQLALIEVKTSELGTLRYDIPSHLKKSKSDNRARRDNYTCLLMAYYASKHYFNLMTQEDNIEQESIVFFC